MLCATLNVSDAIMYHVSTSFKATTTFSSLRLEHSFPPSHQPNQYYPLLSHPSPVSIPSCIDHHSTSMEAGVLSFHMSRAEHMNVCIIIIIINIIVSLFNTGEFNYFILSYTLPGGGSTKTSVKLRIRAKRRATSTSTP